jgi:hypothetical protein
VGLTCEALPKIPDGGSCRDATECDSGTCCAPRGLSGICLSDCGSRGQGVPCGFDQFGRPVGLQLVGKPRGEAALLQAAALFEQLLGLNRLLPIDPKPGAVPPMS